MFNLICRAEYWGYAEMLAQEFDVRKFEGLVAELPGLVAGGVSEEREGLAHDACNLLSAVGLYCELMSQPGVVAGAYQHYIGDLQKLAERSGELIERLLLRGRMQGPSISAVARPVPKKKIKAVRNGVAVAKALQESAAMLQVLAGERVQVEMECHLQSATAVAMEEEALLRVLVNLTVNAREAMCGAARDGGIGRLRIAAQPVPAPWERRECDAAGAAQFVLLTLQDSGPGLPAALAGWMNRTGQHKSEANFSRTKDVRRGRSRGIGLKIVRELVESAGGRVHVLSANVPARGREGAGSEPGVEFVPEIFAGTRFEILLPVAKAEGGAAVETVRK